MFLFVVKYLWASTYTLYWVNFYLIYPWFLPESLISLDVLKFWFSLILSFRFYLLVDIFCKKYFSPSTEDKILFLLRRQDKTIFF